MADSFSADPEAPMRTDGGDPFAYVGAEQPSVPRFTAAVPAAGSISVPLWMRGGAIFASAASRYVPECSAAPYRPTGFLRSDAEFRRATYYGLMSNIACEHGIPVGLFDAVIIRESRYQPNIYSPKNAFGLTQLMPGTAAQLGVDRYHVEQSSRRRQISAAATRSLWSLSPCPGGLQRWTWPRAERCRAPDSGNAGLCRQCAVELVAAERLSASGDNRAPGNGWSGHGGTSCRTICDRIDLLNQVVQSAVPF
ncbi:transglycosylase SLT domain-containing protein [Novosphingobium panipatense]